MAGCMGAGGMGEEWGMGCVRGFGCEKMIKWGDEREM